MDLEPKLIVFWFNYANGFLFSFTFQAKSRHRHQSLLYGPRKVKIKKRSFNASIRQTREGWPLPSCKGIDLLRGPGLDPSILRHSGVWGAADEAVLNKVLKRNLEYRYTLQYSLLYTVLNSVLCSTEKYFSVPPSCSTGSRCGTYIFHPVTLIWIDHISTYCAGYIYMCLWP
jgi:hypothetical protein